MIKILQVVSSLALGGTEAFIMNNYRILDRSNYSFDFLVFIEKDWPYLDEIKSLGGKVFFAFPPTIFNQKKFTLLLKKINHQAGGYDVIHSHINLQNSFVMAAARKIGIPKRISHSHDTHGKRDRGLRSIYVKYRQQLILKSATDFLACSNDAGEYLYGGEFYRKKGKTISNGINVSNYLFSREVGILKRRQLGLPDDSVIIGNITRFEPKKNQLFTIKTFNEILKERGNAYLLLGGPDGGQLRECETLVRELQIENHVKFLGARTDVRELLCAIDVYLFPSLYEGLGIGLLEAQASGCLCFASTGVSCEANMGIGNLFFIDLDKGTEFWAKFILDELKGFQRPQNEQVLNAFVNNGFDISASHKILMSVYNEK